jgi:hypothetical protein
MTLFQSFFFLEEGHPGAWWKRWRSCFFTRFMFAQYTNYSRSGLIVLSLGVLFAACSGPSIGGSAATPTPKPTPTPATLNLTQVPWCGKPLMVFRNLAASGTPGITSGSATTMTDWTQIKPMLGFTIYLPTMLPNGSCLVSASGTVHDPILGGNFVIGYILPDHSSLTLSEAPQRSKSATLQCRPTANSGTKTTPTSQDSVQICSGAHGTTSIVFSSHDKTDALQQFFSALQPDVNWVPTA